MSAKAITNKILKIESENELFQWEINGIFVWEIIRHKIYSIGLYQTLESDNKNKNASYRYILYYLNLKKIFNAVKKLANSIVLNPFFNKNKVDALVFESSRKLVFNESYIDPYTKFMCDDFIKTNKSFTKYQSSYAFDKLAKRDFSTKSIDLIYLLSALRSKFSSFVFTNTQLSKIEAIEKIFNQELALKLNLKILIENEMKLFVNTGVFFDGLLKRKKPKEIYIVNFCDKAPLIAKAKENGIKVIDIQHGLISSNDIIYHYPNVKEGSLCYFPDQFLVWSTIWSGISKIPLTNENIIAYGNSYLEQQKKKYSHIAKNKKQIIIISQPALTDKIATETLLNINNFKSYKVLYKLHPIEYSLESKNEIISELKKINNITFVGQNEDLYKLLAESYFVIGVGSTVLFEALSFDCDVQVFDLPGIEWMEPFLNKGVMKLYNQELFCKAFA